MPNILRAAEGGDVAVQSVSGPSDYDSGTGFTVTSDLGRVDEFMVYEGADSVKTANPSVTNDNEMVVQAFSQDSGTEYADTADLSDANYTFVSFRL